MAKIIGNTTATPNPQPDWLQVDDKKADYIKNKPDMNYDTQMNSVSFGTNTHAGGKGFKVVGIVEENGTVVGYDLRTTDGLEVGQIYSVRLDSAAYNCGEITEISGNRIKVSNAPNIKALNENVDNPENGFVGNVLTIKGRHDLGDVDVGFNAFAEGSGNYASEANAHAEGSNNYSLGKASHTEGSGNIAGYNAHAEGSGNTASGDQSHAEGVGNTASGGASHVEGNGNEASGKRSHAGGYKTKASGEDAFAHGEYAVARGSNSVAFGYSVSASGTNQAVFGEFNEVKDEPLFIVGNGESGNERSNAFEVHKDGRATVAKAGTGENDVATYGQIVPKITKPETDKAEYVYTRTPSGGIDLKRCTLHADGSTLVSRDKDGRFRAADPDDDLDVANKQYVDDTVANVEVDLTGYATEEYVQDEIAKIDIGDALNIVQATGYSETAIMSQKAVTETLEGKSVSETLTFNEMEYTSNTLSDKVEVHVQRVSGGRAFVEVNDEVNPTYYEFKKTAFSKLVNTSKDQTSQSEVDFGSVELGWNDVLDVEGGTKTTSETATFTFQNVERIEEPIYATDWEIDDSYTWWDDNENMICKFTYDSYGRMSVISGPPAACTHGEAYIGESVGPIPVYKSLNDVPETAVPDYIYFVYYSEEPNDHYEFEFITSQFSNSEELLQAGDIVINWINADDDDAVVRQDKIDCKYKTGDYNVVYTNPGWVSLGGNVKVDWTDVGLNDTTTVALSYSLSELQVSNDTNMLCNFITDKVEYSATSDKNKCTKNPFNAPMVYCIKDGAFVVVLPGWKTLKDFLIVLWNLQNNSGKSMQLYYETGRQTKSDISLDGSFVYHDGGSLKFVDNNGEVIEDMLTVELMWSMSGYLKQAVSHSDKDRLYMVDKNGDNTVVAVDDVIDENNIARRDYVSDWFDWLNDYFGFTVGLEYILTDDRTAYSVASAGLADGANDVVIMPKFKNKDVVEIGDNAFTGNTNITGVSMPDTITTIGDKAFKGCTSLVVDGENLPEALISIGARAFADVNKLKTNKLKIPNGVTEILDRSFENCSNLTDISIPSTTTTVYASSFYGCPIDTATIPANAALAMPRSTLSTVTINGGEKIKNNAFKECAALTKVVFDSEIATIGDSAFDGCTKLNNITIPNTVTNIGSKAFANTKISEITIPQTTTTVSDSAFENCPIDTATIPACAALAMPRSTLSTVTINGGTEIPDSALDGCDQLTSITLPNTITSIGSDAFNECDSLKDVYIDDLSKWCEMSFGNGAANPLCYAENLYLNDELVTEIQIPDNVAQLRDYVFYNYDNLQKVTVGRDVNSISATSFVGCDGLEEFSVSENNDIYSVNDGNLYGRTGTSQSGGSGGENLKMNLKMIRYANAKEDKYFETLTRDDIDNMRIAKHAFDGAKNLINVLIHDNVVAIEPSAFSRCDNAKFFCVEDSKPTIWADDWNPLNRPVYWGITFPDETSAALEFTNNDEDMTASIKCTDREVETVTIPTIMNGYAIQKITDGAFNYCTNLTSVTIGNGVTSIGVQAFAGCSSIQSIVIPSGVESIAKEAFSGCTNLKTIVIPASVTTMGYTVFLDCSNVHIYCEAESKPDGWSVAWSSGSSGNITWGYTG